MTLTAPSGEVALSSNLELGSIYSGLSTSIEILVPDQLPDGEYSLEIALHDQGSDANASITDGEVTLSSLKDRTGVSVVESSVSPNSEEVVFANVDIALDNGGQQIPASNVMLEVMRDGELVEEYPLATNQVLLSGENHYTDRYIPAEMWESGTYTFNLVVSAVDPTGGQETILLDEELDATIEVP